VQLNKPDLVDVPFFLNSCNGFVMMTAL